MQQEWVNTNLDFEKIGTKENHTDMLTKALDKGTRDRHLGEMDLSVRDGRSGMSKRVSTLA